METKKVFYGVEYNLGAITKLTEVIDILVGDMVYTDMDNAEQVSIEATIRELTESIRFHNNDAINCLKRL